VCVFPANFRRFPVGTRRDANTRTRVALRGRVRPPVYYCEAGTVTLRLRVPVGWLYTTVPFAFGLRFKFLNNRQASMRLVTAAESKELGEPVPGTNCSRNFYECYRDKRCSPQSPNYPGMYPRNVTCRYTVRQNMEPKCKHAMFSGDPGPAELGADGAARLVVVGRKTGPADGRRRFQSPGQRDGHHTRDRHVQRKRWQAITTSGIPRPVDRWRSGAVALLRAVMMRSRHDGGVQVAVAQFRPCPGCGVSSWTCA